MSQVKVTQLHSLKGHLDCIYTLEGGGEPGSFFSASGDGMVVGWDLRNPEAGQLVARLPNAVYALHFLREPGWLVCGHNHDGIHVLDPVAKKEIRAMPLTTSAIFDIRSAGHDLFIGCGDGQVKVVDMRDWSIRKSLSFSEKSARTIALNPVTGEMAVGYSDHMIRVFGLDDCSLKFELAGHKNSVFVLAYTPDGKTLVSGSRDARLMTWEVAGGYNRSREVAAHLYAINHIAFSPDGKHFVTCSLDKSIKVWQADEFRLLKVIDKARHAGHGTSVNKLYWSSFNDLLVSAGDDRTINVWELVF